MDSQEEQGQDSYNEVSDGIPMLASDSEKVSYLLQKGLCHPYGVQESSPGLPPRPCLLFQVQAVTLLYPLVSIY